MNDKILLHKLASSTLAPGYARTMDYHKTIAHAAVFAGDEIIASFGPAEEKESMD